MPAIHVEHAAFAHRDAAPLFQDLCFQLTAGWTGLVGENGAGKTTLLRLLAGELPPTGGHIRLAPTGARVAICAQDVDAPARDVVAFEARTDADALARRARLELGPDDAPPWAERSPGERRRWQLAAALAAEPEVLLLDEPTNHADAPLREALVSELGRFRGVGVVVSHDRALLETLCARTLRLHDGRATRFDAPYGRARALWEAELRDRWSAREHAARAAERADRRLAHARRTRASAERSRSGRHRDPHDSDARTMGAKNRVAWAEARLGANVTRLRAAAERAHDAIPDVPAGVELGRSVFVDYAPPPRRTLLTLDAPEVTAGARPVLRDVHVHVARGDRLRIAGPNGAGKTTLLRALLDRSALPADRVLHLPQELPPGHGRRLVAEVRSEPRDVRGRVLSLVAALGSDPARLLASADPSPGETRKLQLALGLGRHVWALALDEPTNHLDLPTVERLERALAGYPGALVLVTHDDAFAAACTRATWALEGGRVRVG